MRYYFVAALFFLSSLSAFAQQTYYVSTTGQDDAGRDGLSVATAWKSLEYASNRVPAGQHTIQLGNGTFPVSKTVSLKDGWTINGSGHTGTQTTTITNTATFSPQGKTCLPLNEEKKDFPYENYLIGGGGLEDITISNLVLTSRIDTPLDGAIDFKYAKNIEFFNLTVREFPWNGIYLREGKQVNIHDCFFENASYVRKCNTYGGAIRTRYMKEMVVSHCEFKLTKGWGYGYKGSGHEDAKVHDNIFHGKTTLGANETYRPFDFESAHTQEWGFEIYNNTFNGMVSVPKSDNQGLTSNSGDKKTYPYSIRIHHNTFYGSAGVEGPRSHLEIDHNYFAQKWNNNGRVYEIHGASVDDVGPTSIHHNVAECSMGFVFKKNERSADVSIYNNTVYLVNATRNNFPTSFLEVGGAVKNWQVKNNLVFTQDDPNSGVRFNRGSLPGTGITLQKNVAWNIPSTPSSVTQNDPELKLSGIKPTDYYAAQSAGSYVVDQGVDVGHPYEGSAPDIGAYEWKSSVPTPTAQHTITASAGSNGSISPKGSIKVDENDDQTFAISANDGYRIKDVTVDGSSVGTKQTYTFENVAKDHTIIASFEVVPPTTVAVSSVSVTGTSTITTDGGSTQLSATLEPSNASDKSVTWTIEGQDLGATLTSSGKLTASGEDGGNGKLTVRATAQDGSDEFGEVVVTISNQASDPIADTTPPSKPILTASSTTQTTTKLAWNAVTDNVAVTSYQLFQDGNKIADLPASQTTYTASGLVASTNYAFVLKAYNAAANSSASDALSLTTLDPDAVTFTITATASDNGNISPSGQVIVAQGQDQTFTITASEGYETEDVLVDGSSVGAMSSFTFPKVAQDHTISASFVAIPDNQAPTTPVLASPQQDQNTVTLTWAAASDNQTVATYTIWQNGQPIATQGADTLSFTLLNLPPGEHTFTITATDAAGNATPPSQAVSVTVPPTSANDSTDTQAPEPFELTAVADEQGFTLAWTTPQDNYGITSYILYQNGNVIDTLTATATTYRLATLSADSTYTFTLVAFDAAGNASEASYTVEPDTVVEPAPGEPTPEPPLTQAPTLAPPLFTPNDDGQNDAWQITLAPDEQLTSLKVYDQRGSVVFATSNANQSWNGTFQNQPLSKGAYYYTLTIKDSNGVPQSITGSVALLR